ncbi:MAG TPA: biopolymer transporter ExbD [Novimethylophilus sp.]|jgi:biopolymer transport protein ExbD|uniref:ExbD/TolR family protein n=1 Tax=Novimethylophilus sp. TaxID=2137426 RepID=UPI002F410FB6
MAFGGFNSSGSNQPMAEINMVPLIDVMLVLLVIFIVTAPLLTHAVKIDLPRASSNPNISQAEKIQIAINAQGTVYWNGEIVEEASLRTRMAAAARLDPQPELHLRADRITHYEKVARVMSDAAQAGLVKIGFVTDPNDVQ